MMLQKTSYECEMYGTGNFIFLSQSHWIFVQYSGMLVSFLTLVSQTDLSVLLAREVQSVAMCGIGVSPTEVSGLVALC